MAKVGLHKTLAFISPFLPVVSRRSGSWASPSTRGNSTWWAYSRGCPALGGKTLEEKTKGAMQEGEEECDFQPWKLEVSVGFLCPLQRGKEVPSEASATQAAKQALTR